MSDSLQAYGLKLVRLPYPSPSPGTFSNSCPLSQWCHPTISSSCHSLLLPSVFPNESALHNTWPNYWIFSFSISPSNEYSELISFRIDWFDLLAVQELSRVFSSTTVPKHQFFSAQLFYCLALTFIQDCWKKHLIYTLQVFILTYALKFFFFTILEYHWILSKFLSSSGSFYSRIPIISFLDLPWVSSLLISSLSFFNYIGCLLTLSPF